MRTLEQEVLKKIAKKSLFVKLINKNIVRGYL